MSDEAIQLLRGELSRTGILVGQFVEKTALIQVYLNRLDAAQFDEWQLNRRDHDRAILVRELMLASEMQTVLREIRRLQTALLYRLESGDCQIYASEMRPLTNAAWRRDFLVEAMAEPAAAFKEGER